MTNRQTPCLDSPLHRLDPRWRLASLLAAAVAFALLKTLPAVVAALAVSLLLIGAAKVSLHWFLKRLRPIVLFVALFTVPLPLLARDDGPSWEFGPLSFSLQGVVTALIIFGKAITIANLMLVLFATALPGATLKAAHSLWLPSLLIQLTALTIRYVAVLGQELARIRIALRVRGYRNRMDRHSYRTIGHVAGTLLVRGFERAERIGQAMRSRGFDGRFRALTEFHTASADVLLFLVTVGTAAGLLVWDRCT